MIEAVARKTAELLNISRSDERWVCVNDYCRHWGVSAMHLHRHKEWFRRKGAVVGKGKAIRYDRFFCPQDGHWRYA
jgi:hypothetical protein